MPASVHVELQDLEVAAAMNDLLGVPKAPHLDGLILCSCVRATYTLYAYNGQPSFFVGHRPL